MVALNQADLQAEEAHIADQVKTSLAEFESQRSSLIPILQMIQQRHAYLPAAVLDVVADYLGLSAGEVFGVATFYNQFRFYPPGRNPIKVCLGTACHVRGGDIILENFERKLEIKEGETTADREFSIERVACVGCCALAPVALVGETLHGKMAPSKVEGLILRIAIEREKKEREAQRAQKSDNDSNPS
jgi:NADH-quinone oxidoreductase subunit E